MDKGNLETFYTSKPEGKFIALYGDGSGCSMWHKKEEGFFDQEGGLIHNDPDWFIEAGYLFFVELPDTFQFWHEHKGG